MTELKSELANGDPIIVYDPNCAETRSLGTGFEGMNDLREELNHAIETGHSTWNITRENASWLEGREELEIFTFMTRVER